MHQDEPGSLQSAQEVLGGEVRHSLVRVRVAAPAIVSEGEGEGEGDVFEVSGGEFGRGRHRENIRGTSTGLSRVEVV